jgi:hypothetical protein
MPGVDCHVGQVGAYLLKLIKALKISIPTELST